MTIGKKLSEQKVALSVLSYGPPGTGKTTGALTLADRGRVLLIDAEGGAKASALKTRGIKVSNVDVWPDSPDQLSFDAIEDVYLQVAASKEYAGVVIDSMTELARRLLEGVVGAAIAKAERLGKARDRWQTDLADYGIASQQMRLILRRFRDLNIHLVLTALERRDIDDDGKVSYGPAMGPSVAVDTMGLVDVVCYHSVEDIGDQTFYLGTTVPHNRRKAKDRLGALPARMVDPGAARMLEYVEGKLTKDKDPLQEAARKAATGEGPAAIAEEIELEQVAG